MLVSFRLADFWFWFLHHDQFLTSPSLFSIVTLKIDYDAEIKTKKRAPMKTPKIAHVHRVIVAFAGEESHQRFVCVKKHFI